MFKQKKKVRNEDALRNNKFLPDMAQAYNSSTWDADAREHRV